MTKLLEADPIDYAEEIRLQCTILGEFLSGKNACYGSSIFEPVRMFSRADAMEQIKVRIDDKLSRIGNSKQYPGDDDLKDLTGYLIILMVAERLNGRTI